LLNGRQRSSTGLGHCLSSRCDRLRPDRFEMRRIVHNTSASSNARSEV
jgi:hypothetical protein